MFLKTNPLPLVILLLSLALFCGCGKRAKLEEVPKYLQKQIEEYSPNNRVTAYETNGPFGGRVTCLARQGNTLFAGTRTSGIFRSDDSGQTWEQINNGLDEFGITAILSGRDVLLAGTVNGIFRSDDYGASWRLVTERKINPIEIDALHSFGDKLLAATMNYGVLVSNDQGLSWSRIKPIITPSNLGKPPRYGYTLAESLEHANNFAVIDDTLMAIDQTNIYRSRDMVNWEFVGNSIAPIQTVSVLGGVLYAGTSRGLSRSNDKGRSWKNMGEGIGTNSLQAFVVGDSLCVSTNDSLRCGNPINLSWTDVGVPNGYHYLYEPVTGLVEVGDTLIAGTGNNIYYKNKKNLTGIWNEARGLKAFSSVGKIINVESSWLVVEDGILYRTDNDGESWKSLSEHLELVEEDKSKTYPAVNDIINVGEKFYVATDNGLYQGDLRGEAWKRIKTLPPDKFRNSESREVDALASQNGNLFAVTVANIYRSKDYGQSWESIGRGLELSAGSRGRVVGLASLSETLFVSILNLRKPNVYRLRENGNDWESINGGIGGATLGNFIISGNSLYASSSREAPFQGPTPNLFWLANASTDTTWQRLAAGGLEGLVASLWVDPNYPEIVLAGTTQGLFWSDNGGNQFNQIALPAGKRNPKVVGSITSKGGPTFISTDAGVFYIQDRLQRGKWYARVFSYPLNHLEIFAGIILGCLLMTIFSTRLILMLLQLEIWPIKAVAPWFYLLPAGRWKLYRRYRKSLLNSDIPSDALRYVDLPYLCDGLNDANAKLSNLFSKLPVSKRIMAVADGGRGKSTLCNHVTWRCLVGKDIFMGKRLEPVVVDGLAYTGDLLSSITDSLKNNRAYINSVIVESQLEAGHLLVIFDGYSEIREKYLEAASSTDIPTFIRRHPDTGFLFTSRSDFPSNVRQSLGDSLTIRPQDVDDKTEQEFLSQYLKRREQDVDSLISQINLRFPTLPRIPLMLKLIAVVYDKRGNVPKDRLELFGDYVEQLLRPESVGVDEPVGLNFAIRYLVMKTYLKSGGDRGFTRERGVEVIREIRDILRDEYDIPFSSIKLLNLLTRAGLYRRTGEVMRFFHDSFESYFAARALESDFRNGKYESILQCWNNIRLEETWDFFNLILKETNDEARLQEIVASVQIQIGTSIMTQQLLNDVSA